MLYTFKGELPTNLPTRIRLSNGLTKTQPFSDEDLISAGYRQVDEKPIVSNLQKIEWSGSGWLVFDKSEEDLLEEWNKIRELRDEKIKEVEWRYNRYYRHQRLSLTQIDSIESLDNYVQALADITKQSNPFIIQWPTLET